MNNNRLGGSHTVRSPRTTLGM